MSDRPLAVIEGAGPAQALAGELAQRIKDVVREYGGRMAVATAVGAIEIAKLEIMKENGDE